MRIPASLLLFSDLGQYLKIDLLQPGRMDKFLETHNLLRLNHEEIENLNRLIISNDIEALI